MPRRSRAPASSALAIVPDRGRLLGDAASRPRRPHRRRRRRHRLPTSAASATSPRGRSATPAATATATAVPSVAATRRILDRSSRSCPSSRSGTPLGVSEHAARGRLRACRPVHVTAATAPPSACPTAPSGARGPLDGETAASSSSMAIASGPDGYARSRTVTPRRATGRSSMARPSSRRMVGPGVDRPDQASLEWSGAGRRRRATRRWLDRRLGSTSGPSHFFGFDTWSSSDGLDLDAASPRCRRSDRFTGRARPSPEA